MICPPSIDWRGYGSIDIIFSLKRAFNYVPVTFKGGTHHGMVQRGYSVYTKIRYSTPFVCVSKSARAVNTHLYLGSELKKLQRYHPFQFDVFTVGNILSKSFTRYLCPPLYCSSIILSIASNTFD